MPCLRFRLEPGISNEFMWTQSPDWSSRQEHFLIIWFRKPLKEFLNYAAVIQLNQQVAQIPFLKI